MDGSKLAGGNPAQGRVEHDYYATNPVAVKMLLDAYRFNPGNWLEPCVGAGHIANVINDTYGVTCDGIDIVDRGYPNTQVCDFLRYSTDKKYQNIITNPPYSLAEAFVRKAYSLLEEGGKTAMFLRIQFLEGQGRKRLHEEMPPRYIYVFSARMPIFRNGEKLDPSTGKPWATTLCNAWFVWEKGYQGEPTVRWL